ncbi:hypothetical protein Rhe02_52340 [Rhizocola hellebori]|uniref:Uncharacterized protein n=1 Tax=Rhizocola hellebori TaxID=1392758 RepID=A0A8J3VIA3_9ACTN|nr:hypothetical protein Rhe02_52340 [Rhizocola hellebori]
MAGRPGILHVLDEFASLAPARIVVVYHPFYERFMAWAQTTLGAGGRAAYQRAAGMPATDPPLHEKLDLTFIPQRGRYADITSILNAAAHFEPADVFVAFADNLYPGDNPAASLALAPAKRAIVLARPYRREEASVRGVIVSRYHDGLCLLTDLVEKPPPAEAGRLEAEHGYENLWLLEGRARLPWTMIRELGSRARRLGPEPKLSLAIRDHAHNEPVIVITTESAVIDLGSGALNFAEIAAQPG